ncbi:hypothetical protein HDG41_002338 [Paraburkholderia sp. JPY162]|uniref:Uncharacterized protein n=1 Tax=Paraburkholderia youngii TaxID=2782701 RepID=A0A7W8P0L3_9BURK|nr:hypothetical protein [Paraburkholderia youngii]
MPARSWTVGTASWRVTTTTAIRPHSSEASDIAALLPHNWQLFSLSPDSPFVKWIRRPPMQHLETDSFGKLLPPRSVLEIKSLSYDGHPFLTKVSRLVY